jgi:hypothetical protein
VIVTELAETSVAYLAGELLGMAVIPIVGVILLIVGLQRRSRGPQLPSGYPPPVPNAYGPPAPNPYPPPNPYGPPAPPPYYPPPPPARSSSALIVFGLLLLAGGLVGIASRATQDLAHKADPQPSVRVGQCIA